MRLENNCKGNACLAHALMFSFLFECICKVSHIFCCLNPGKETVLVSLAGCFSTPNLLGKRLQQHYMSQPLWSRAFGNLFHSWSVILKIVSISIVPFTLVLWLQVERICLLLSSSECSFLMFYGKTVTKCICLHVYS